MSSAEALELYSAERKNYDKLAMLCAQRARVACQRGGIPCSTEGRSKDPASLLKKLIRRGIQYSQVIDKAGARIVLVHPSDAERATRVIVDEFYVHKLDDKRDTLPDRFNYSGFHLDVSLKDIDVRGDEALRGLRCEIQVHTPGESFWAKIAHDLTYKSVGEVPKEHMRAIYRLRGLTELVDREVTRVREDMVKDIMHGEAAGVLERKFFELTGKDYDRKLTSIVLGQLVAVLPPELTSRLGNDILAHIEMNWGKLTGLYAQYRDDLRNPLLWQPEALLIFFLLDKAFSRLEEHWPSCLESSLFENFATVWNVPSN